MKLILSSCDFRNDRSSQCIYNNLPKPVAQCKLLFIPNEKATHEKIQSKKYRNRMQEFGFTYDNTIVFDHTDPIAYKNLDIDVLYISGGNTFAILDRLRKCGFDAEIVRYIRSGVTYIGGSAGAHIVSKNIEHVLQYDANPTDMTDYNGLGLLDGILICHYTPERQAHYENLVADGVYQVYLLSDDDSIVIKE